MYIYGPSCTRIDCKIVAATPPTLSCPPTDPPTDTIQRIIPVSMSLDNRIPRVREHTRDGIGFDAVNGGNRIVLPPTVLNN